MAKSQQRLKALELRRHGKSVKEISKELKVAKSTASLWTRDVALTIEQLEKLRHKMITGGELGRLRGALNQKENRIKRYSQESLKVRNEIKSLSPRERLLIGAALYWAEGTKKGRRVDFCNSDPNLIKFMVSWFREQFDIKINEFKVQLGINEAHINRESVVKEYWSNLIGIPLTQFTKTSFKHAKLRKEYENFNEYFGTPKIYITSPSRIHPRVIGLIDFLKISAT